MFRQNVKNSFYLPSKKRWIDNEKWRYACVTHTYIHTYVYKGMGSMQAKHFNVRRRSNKSPLFINGHRRRTALNESIQKHTIKTHFKHLYLRITIVIALNHKRFESFYSPFTRPSIHPFNETSFVLYPIPHSHTQFVANDFIFFPFISR